MIVGTREAGDIGARHQSTPTDTSSSQSHTRRTTQAQI
jgi:hypothetical protein